MRRGSAEPTEAPRQRTTALAILGVVWLAFVFPMFGGRVHFPTDFVNLFYAAPGSRPAVSSNLVDTDVYLELYPWHEELGRSLRAGHLPLWDPSRFAGAPYAADIGTGTFYPPNWLYAFGHVEVVMTIIWAATVLASLLLAWWFLSLLGLHPLAAALGAVVWTFSGFMVSEGMFDALVGAAVWLPMALGGLELARRGRPRRGVPIAALALALSVLAGHVQIALYVWLAVGIWVLIMALAAAHEAARQRGNVLAALARNLGPAAAAAAIAAGLASIQILGTLEEAGQIVRQKETVLSASSIRLAPRNLLTLVIPDYLGNARDGTWAGWLGFSIETTIYAGIATIPVAVAGLWHRNRRAVVAFGLLAVVGLAAALATPVYHLLFALVPGVSRTRDVTRFKLLFDVGVAGLAALGLDEVLRLRWGAVRVGIGAVAVMTGLALVLTVARPGTHLSAGYIAVRGMRSVLLVSACGVLMVVIARVPSRRQVGAVGLIALVGLDLWIFGFPYHPFQRPGTVYPASPAATYLASVPGTRPRFALAKQNVLPVNSALEYGLYSVNGYEPFIPATFVLLLNELEPDMAAWALEANTTPPLSLGASEPPLLDLLGVRTVATPTGASGPGDPVTLPGLGTASPGALYDQAKALPPAFLATCWTVQPDRVALPLLGGMATADLAATAVVAPGAASGGLAASPPDCPQSPGLAVTRYRPGDVVLTVPGTSARGGIVVLSDQWFPGWAARLDGRPAPILRVDEALRGVAVPGGAHTIEFRYLPRWPLQGLAVVTFTLALVCLLLVGPPGRRRFVAPAGR